ncbi:hypothetical protein F2P45_33990, partial [Massilia sp. CCM 8733]|nr:hypothetical protein [Massilia mucilaginosa]
MAGVDGAKLAVAGAAIEAPSALQSGAGLGGLASAGAALAAQANPKVAQAMKVAGQAQALLGQAGDIAGKLPNMPFVPDARALGDAIGGQIPHMPFVPDA